MRRVWIEIYVWDFNIFFYSSPSMRRVWIEIPREPMARTRSTVTLHAEGVD